MIAELDSTLHAVLHENYERAKRSTGRPANVTGQPATSLLSLHTNNAGLPIDVQLVAAFGRDDLLVRVASQLERAVNGSAADPTGGG